jgi:hypothetical protein
MAPGMMIKERVKREKKDDGANLFVQLFKLRSGSNVEL